MPGALTNRGVEFEIAWNDHVGEFSYSAALNLSHVKNRVDDLGYGQTVLPHRCIVEQNR